MNANLYICGPANGSVAYSFPHFQRAADDSLFLPSSECELVERQTVFRLNRACTNGVPTLRVGVYQQIFEHGMNRLGHSFGAVFEFTNEVPRGQIVAHTLVELIEVIKQNCVVSSHFCNSERFSDFLSKEIQPSFEGIIHQLNPSSMLSIVAIQLASGQGIQYFTESLPNSTEQVGALFEWFASDPSAVLCETLLIGVQIKTGRAFLPLQIEKVATATTLHLYKTVSTLQSDLNDAVQTVKEGDSTIAALQLETKQLINQIETAQHESSSATKSVTLLKQELDFLRKNGNSSGRGITNPLPPQGSPSSPLPKSQGKQGSAHGSFSGGIDQSQLISLKVHQPLSPQNTQSTGIRQLNGVKDEQLHALVSTSSNNSYRRRSKHEEQYQDHTYERILIVLGVGITVIALVVLLYVKYPSITNFLG